eukprot:ANDGO_01397.mRNA.1 Cyclin-dependent kinase B1-1
MSFPLNSFSSPVRTASSDTPQTSPMTPFAVPTRRSFGDRSQRRRFQRLDRISAGAFGTVYRGREIETGREDFAIKCFKDDLKREVSMFGVPASLLREASAAYQCPDHDHIVKIVHIYIPPRVPREISIPSSAALSVSTTAASPSSAPNAADSAVSGMHSLTYRDTEQACMSIEIVFELLDTDLYTYMKERLPKGVRLAPNRVRRWLWQIISAVSCFHAHDLVHRDLKPQNILLRVKDDCLKIADFGISRSATEASRRQFTPQMVTLWYRPPEVLLGEERYGPEVDMWSVGCLFAELVRRIPLFNAKEELGQLDAIFRTLGSPTASEWPSFTSTKGYNPVFSRYPRMAWIDSLGFRNSLSPLGCDLLVRLLQYDPANRLTAQSALQHPYFAEDPQLVQEISLKQYDLDSACRPRSGVLLFPSEDSQMKADLESDAERCSQYTTSSQRSISVKNTTPSAAFNIPECRKRAKAECMRQIDAYLGIHDSKLDSQETTEDDDLGGSGDDNEHDYDIWEEEDDDDDDDDGDGDGADGGDNGGSNRNKSGADGRDDVPVTAPSAKRLRSS